MEILNNFFSLEMIIKIGAAVFSLLFVIFTIQMYANVSQIVRTVITKRNGAFKFVSLIFLVMSLMLFVLSFVIL